MGVQSVAETEITGLPEHLGLSGRLFPHSLVSLYGLSIWGTLGFLMGWRTQDKGTICMAV